MMGARKPALPATLTKCAWKGNPEGLARGNGLRPREPMPRFCARVARPSRASAPKGRVNSFLRVTSYQHNAGAYAFSGFRGFSGGNRSLTVGGRARGGGVLLGVNRAPRTQRS